MTDRTGNNCHLKDNALLIVPKRRGHGCHRGSPGETVGIGVWGVVMRWKEGEDLRAKAFVMVSPEGMGEAGSAGLELAILSDFLRLWGQGVVPLVWNLVLGTSCPEFESDTGGGGSVGSVFEKHTCGQDSCCSVAQSWPTLCNPTDCSTSGFPVLHYPSELAQTPAQQVSDAIQLSHPLSPPCLPALSLSQHQGL